jgi:methionine biosynthesis protein MetW
MSEKIKYTFSHEPTGTHALVLQEVAPNSTVLDVGCASGYLGEYLIQKKYCRLFGIEPDRSSYLIASKKGYEQIEQACIEDALLHHTYERPFDFILLADVLEHTHNPDYVLHLLSPLISDSGNLIVSLPNVAHYSIRLALFFGKWDMTETGIMDRTHLHFYTKKTAQELFRKNGWTLVRVRARGDIERWLARFRMKRLGFWLLDCLSGFFAVQYIFVLKKKSSS